MTADWYMFGCAMEMNTTDLNIIQNQGGLQLYMKNMLEEWLNTGSATWEKLQEALRSVGNKRLASELENHKLTGASASTDGSKYMCQAFYQRKGVNMWEITLAFSPHHMSDVSICILQ